MRREDIFEYVKEKYQTDPEYLWKKYPNYAYYDIKIIENGMPLLWT